MDKMQHNSIIPEDQSPSKLSRTISQNNDIEKDEEDIFKELGSYDFKSLPSKLAEEQARARIAKRKQLALSSDSPFYNSEYDKKLTELELMRLKEQKAIILRHETEEIKKQLDYVKNRLHELQSKGHTDSSDNATAPNQTLAQSKLSHKDTRVHQPLYDHEMSSLGNDGFNGKQTSCRNLDKRVLRDAKSGPKLRPLTGKTDCPNCMCDRRQSICENCTGLMRHGSQFDMNDESSVPKRSNSNLRVTIDPDERPIRPAKVSTSPARPLARVEVVDDVVVPNRIYTIGRSLNDKRTKLAQAIDDLQTMVERVERKGHRLDEERKVVQLYKNQWKYGTTIGGPVASPRARIGLRNTSYESRLDADLARDTNALMGFQNVKSTMAKTRQISAPTKFRSRLQPNRSTSLESINKLGSSRIFRSAAQGDKMTAIRQSANNFNNGRSSSDMNINRSKSSSEEQLNENNDTDEVEEQIEDAIDVSLDTDEPSSNSNSERQSNVVQDQQDTVEKVQKMSWVPVFGETEVKTVKRQPVQSAKRPNVSIPTKTPITRTIGQQSHQFRQSQTPSSRSNSSMQREESVIAESKRKLRFASDIIDHDKRDASKPENQLVIIKNPRPAPIPKPRVSLMKPKANSVANNRCDNETRQVSPRYIANNKKDTDKEIAHLEQMLAEQQRLLTKLLESQQNESHHHTTSPSITVRCVSPCYEEAHHSLPSSSKSLMKNLRDRLHKTKLRLAKTLEDEREKHQALKSKVNSSLRRQSDLQSENELLKKSLSRCIDTCLRDISNTFENLNDGLVDQMRHNSVTGRLESSSDELDTREHSDKSDLESDPVNNVAKIISDTRHLKQMKSHIEVIESQRRMISEELNREKQKTGQLEVKLREGQAELEMLNEAKRRLEAQLRMIQQNRSETQTTSAGESSPDQSGSKQQNNEPKLIDDESGTDHSKTTDSDHGKSILKVSSVEKFESNDFDERFKSVDIYRRFIESISPDIESMKRERKNLLSEFDNIKRLLSDVS